MKMLYVLMVLMVVTNAAHATTARTTTSWTTTTTRGHSGQNLMGKMFTLSEYRGGISFYSPSYFSPTSPPWSSTPLWTTTTRPWITTTRPWTSTTRPWITTTRPWTSTTRSWPTTTGPWPTTTGPWPSTTSPWPTTTTSPTTGVSVCLRYLNDRDYATIFNLSPSSRNQLQLAKSSGGYSLNFQYQSSLFLTPNIRFWSNIGLDIWTRVCLTVDTVKSVAQVFSGSNISIRKMLPFKYVWVGEPVIEISGFDGQLTDVQVWNYPLRYKEIFNYMTSSVYAPYSGSVLTWSSINYSPRGDIVLEDTYEWQGRQPVNSKVRKQRPKEEKKSRKFFNVKKRDERKTEQV